ncbi:MAG: hypothetical protein GTN53_20265 [Candidatus Aminicenantes bacterium]|nr:hypothetical protein [Candidatus Aminicenantes bacterium]NIQ68837.1 hypothetical protein [Candidatus Aminicenantes bacterium]NIT24838.1 hypothetical protein [Candidatus Aminicenantes bacterium]
MKKVCHFTIFFVSIVLLLFMYAPPGAQAIPLLQLYVEGATYDITTESWFLETDFSSPFSLWTIGNIDGPGGAGPISNVHLSAAYNDPGSGTVTITLAPSTTGGFAGYTDPSTPSSPTFIQTVTDGSVPVLSDGSDLPSHGEYGPGVHWQEFDLGDFVTPDSPIGDFIYTLPAPIFGPGGVGLAQINVYEVTVIGNPESVHFDLYDNVQAGNKVKAKFAPFSHDATVPEPYTATMIFLAGGYIGLMGYRRKNRP